MKEEDRDRIERKRKEKEGGKRQREETGGRERERERERAREREKDNKRKKKKEKTKEESKTKKDGILRSNVRQKKTKEHILPYNYRGFEPPLSSFAYDESASLFIHSWPCSRLGGCPWLLSSGTNDVYVCKNLARCTNVNCCMKQGGRVRCPKDEPLMCKAKGRSHGDYLCLSIANMCRDADGLRDTSACGIVHHGYGFWEMLLNYRVALVHTRKHIPRRVCAHPCTWYIQV